MTLLEFARGPMLGIAVVVFVLGIVWRLVHLFLRPSKPDLSEPRSTAIARGALGAIVSRMWHHRTFRERTLAGTLNAYAHHIGLAIVFFGFVLHIGFIERYTGLHWPAVPGWLFATAAAAVFVGLGYALMIRLTSPVLRLLLGFDDGQAHFGWDRKMGSLLELVADHLAEPPKSAGAPARQLGARPDPATGAGGT